MKKIGFLGCGKIGGSLYRHITENGRGEVCFIQDPFWPAEKEAVCPVTDVADEMLYREADLVIECANSSVLRENIRSILKNCDLLMFSVTAFADREFEAQAKALCEEDGRHIYLPHGAILGLDGIFDGRRGIRDVFIETRKSPASLGISCDERTVVFEGTTREACGVFPRNVNVHAAVALAGIGMDRTRSRIIADPAVDTNEHSIAAEGDGFAFRLEISSLGKGAVTGAYTPMSACGSLDRVLGCADPIIFV